MSEITCAAPEGPPPTDFRAFTPAVWAVRLLGKPPADLHANRPETPSDWAQDKAGAAFFYRGLVQLLWERGGTVQAADSIRRDFETATIVAVVIDDLDGTRHVVEARLWEAAATSSRMYWTGSAYLHHPSRRDVKGGLYLMTAAPEPTTRPEPDRPDWWPKPAQAQVNWATDAAVEREAVRRLKADRVAVTETTKAQIMETMAREAGWPWAAKSIGASRRKR